MKFPSVQLFALALGFALAPLSGAHAASQSLALLETEAATPLVCNNGSCKAEFSTYCLQKDRDLPRARAPYEVADGSGALTLVLRDAEGGERRLPARPHVRIAAARGGHMAVTIALPEAVLASFDARRASIEIGERVTLMPVAVAGDANPQTEQDQRLVTGPLRTLGARVVNRNSRGMETVRVLNLLVNALPPTNGIDPGAPKRLWSLALARGLQSEAPEGIARAAKEYDACWRDRLVQLGAYPVRNCVAQRHDRLMWNHGQRYWNAVGAGS